MLWQKILNNKHWKIVKSRHEVSGMIDRPLHYDLQKKFVRKNDNNEHFNGSINNSFTLCVGKNCPYEC